jgi:hypothetical protein
MYATSCAPKVYQPSSAKEARENQEFEALMWGDDARAKHQGDIFMGSSRFRVGDSELGDSVTPCFDL